MPVLVRGLLGALLLLLAQAGLVAGPVHADPVAVDIVSPYDGERGPGTLTVSGTSEGDGDLYVDIPGQQPYPADRQPDGTWSVQVSGLEPGRTYSICAVLDEAGYMLTDCVSYAIADPGVPPRLDVYEPSHGATVYGDFTVWAQVYQFVDFLVTLDGTPVGGGAASSSISVPLTDVAVGTHVIEITLWDLDNDETVRTLTVEVVEEPPSEPTAAVLITSPVDGSSGPADVVLAGTATLPTGTELVVHGVPTDVVDGTWSLPLSLDPDVYHTLCAEVRQTGGGTVTESCITYHAVDPAAPVVSIDSPHDGQVVGAEAYVSGWLQGASSVTLQVDGVDALNVTLDEGSTWWSATLTGLTEGTRTITAVATNDIGTTISAPVTVTVDTTAPSTPTLSKGSTMIRSLPHTIGGTSDPGSTLCVSVNSGSCLDPVTVGDDGRWSYTFTEQIFDMDVDRAARSFTATIWSHDGVNASSFVTVTYKLRLG